jgi:hypothetical protein
VTITLVDLLIVTCTLVVDCDPSCMVALRMPTNVWPHIVVYSISAVGGQKEIFGANHFDFLVKCKLYSLMGASIT